MDSLLSAADAAMFACKARGKNAYAFSSAQAQASGVRANWIVFQDAYLLGVAEIDAQHRQLVRMINELNQELSARSSDCQIRKGFEALLAFTLLHFQTEHRYMLAHNYADSAAHDFEHGQLANDLRLLLDRHQREGDFLVLQKLKDWLLSHIQTADKALGQSLRERGVT